MCRYGKTDVQISDNGGEFNNEVAKHLHALTGIKHKVTSPYHPQANGFVERMNNTLKKILVKSCVDKSKGNWVQSMPGALYSIRFSKQKSIKVTPFEALFHRKKEMPLLLEDDYDDVGQWVKVSDKTVQGVDKSVQGIDESVPCAGETVQGVDDKSVRGVDESVPSAGGSVEGVEESVQGVEWSQSVARTHDVDDDLYSEAMPYLRKMMDLRLALMKNTVLPNIKAAQKKQREVNFPKFCGQEDLLYA